MAKSDQKKASGKRRACSAHPFKRKNKSLSNLKKTEAMKIY